MLIVPSGKRDYARIVLTKEEEKDVRRLHESMSPDGSDIPSLDFWDEIISETKRVPDKPRSEEGKFLGKPKP